MIKSSDFGNTLVCGSVSGTTITFSWTAQSPTGVCNTTIVAYKTAVTGGGQDTFDNSNNDIVADGVDDGAPDATAGIAMVDAAGNVITTCGTPQSTAASTQIHDTAHDDITGQTIVISPVAVHDQVTVTGTSAQPTGTVTLSFFSGNDQCAGTATAQTLLDLSSGTVSGNSVTVDAISFAQTLGPVSYSFLASYNGNSTSHPRRPPASR